MPSGFSGSVPRPYRRDPSFLAIGALAAAGGTFAIVASIAMPMWAHAHGRDVTPAFSLFGAWGVAALFGAYGCIRTYFLTGTSPRPPRGGARLATVTNLNAIARNGERSGAPSASRRAA